MSPSKVLFASRRYPPSTGGMETYSKAMHDALARKADVAAITLGRGSYAHLAWFLPWLLVRAAIELLRGVDVVVAADPIVFTVVRPVARLRRTPVLVFVHGLDLTYTNRIYRLLVRRPLRRAERVVANSRATADVAEGAGISPDRLVVVPAATELAELSGSTSDAGATLRRRFGLADDARALVTVGRLVPRKGVAWFTSKVMSRLDGNVHYLIAGSGPDHDAIASAIVEGHLEDRVHLLGRVDDADRELLLRGATVFVMPNVVVSDDMEGFGLVAVEAALRGTPVVAAGIEGIRDAVIDGETGVLVASEDPAAFVDALRPLLDDEPARARLAREFGDNARRTFGPEATADRLWAAVSALLAPTRRGGEE